MLFEKPTAATRDSAPPGRDQSLPTATRHYVKNQPLKPPFPAGLERAVFAMGCFWGPERYFWETEGVYVTAAGYAGGATPNPTYEEVCAGRTGHAESVLVVFDPSVVTYRNLLEQFWENHNPTQGMRQGNDQGSQYRSAVFALTQAQLDAAKGSREAYQQALNAAGKGTITTQVCSIANFYYAEDYHQQFLAKNPGGYCGMKGTGVSCAI